MPDTEGKKHIERLLTRGRVTSAYFSTSGHIENKQWHSIQVPQMHEPQGSSLTKEDSGVFVDSSDEEQDSALDINEMTTRRETQNALKPESSQGHKKDTNSGYKSLKLTLVKSQDKYQGMILIKSDDKLSVISEKSCDNDTTEVPQLNEIPTKSRKRQADIKTRKRNQKQKSKKSPVREQSPTKKNQLKRRGRHEPQRHVPHPMISANNVNLDIPQMYERQNTAELLNRNEKEIPVARASVNRRISTVRHNMYGMHLRESTKKLQDDIKQTMKKYSTEKSQLMKQLSNLRHQRDHMGDFKLETDSPSTLSMSDASSIRSQSRYYMAPNIAAHKLSKKKKKTHETRVTTIVETPQREGILKLPTISPGSPPRPLLPRARSKTEWDSGKNNSMQNLPPLDPPPGIAAAKEILQESYKIPKVQDSTRHDITRASLPSRTAKKKVHFAEKHSVSEYARRDYHESDYQLSKNYSYTGDTKSLPPVSSTDMYSVSSIKAFSALPPILGKNGDFNHDDVMKATQQYKSLYLKMKDPEQRMKTLAEILYSVRLRMMENEQTMKYGINPKHMKQANTLCDFLMNRNHNSSMSMYSEMSQDSRNRTGIPKNTASRSGRKTGSLQLQNYLRKMSRARRPSEEIRLSRMMGQSDISEGKESSPQAVVN